MSLETPLYNSLSDEEFRLLLDTKTAVMVLGLRETARRFGMSHGYLYDLLSGRRRLTIRAVRRLRAGHTTLLRTPYIVTG